LSIAAAIIVAATAITEKLVVKLQMWPQVKLHESHSIVIKGVDYNFLVEVSN